jgi:hypothetical protein
MSDPSLCHRFPLSLHHSHWFACSPFLSMVSGPFQCHKFPFNLHCSHWFVCSLFLSICLILYRAIGIHLVYMAPISLLSAPVLMSLFCVNSVFCHGPLTQRQQVPPEHWWIPTKLHTVTSQIRVIFIPCLIKTCHISNKSPLLEYGWKWLLRTIWTLQSRTW